MIDDTRFGQLEHPLDADVLLPTQYFAVPVPLPEPERHLRLAILKDALHYVRDYAGATDRRTRAFYEDAVEWFDSRDRSEPFAFESICAALGFAPDAIRRSLRQPLPDRGPATPRGESSRRAA